MNTTATPGMSHVPVRLGEVQYSQNSDETLVAEGLGGGVGVAIWDPASSLAALAHVILPTSGGPGIGDDHPFNYADRAIPHMVAELIRRGADRSQLVARIAGGAQMLRTSGGDGIFDIGGRNVEQVRRELDRAGLNLAGEAVLGHQIRTMSIFPGNGRVTVQSAGTVREL